MHPCLHVYDTIHEITNVYDTSFYLKSTTYSFYTIVISKTMTLHLCF